MYCTEIRVAYGSVIYWKEEGLPGQFVPGTAGSVTARQIGVDFVSPYARVPVLTPAERDAYIRRHWPTQWEAEQLARDESHLASGL